MKFDQAWKEIEENFDWERVHKVMVFLQWEWHTSQGVPSIKEMKECVQELFSEIEKGNVTAVATGGFYAEKYQCESGDAYRLTFTLCDWEAGE